MTGRHRLSLRATLLIGYALGLCLVLGVFSLVAQGLYWRTLIVSLDAELATRAQSLAEGVTMEPGGHFDIDPPDALLAFLASRRDAYFVVWSLDGRIVDLTAPDLAVPMAAAPGARTRGEQREVAIAGPHGTILLAGRSLAAEEAQYGAFTRALGMAGLSALVIAIGSGWLFMRRVLAPIERIGRTAEAMSAANLAPRIDVGETESELGRVAAALNGAFDRLQAAFDRQARFTADASHELRTPLSTVLSEAEWALRRERSAAEYCRAFEVCLRAAQRMHAVVEGLLTLARADAGPPALACRPVDLADIARDALQTAGEQPRANGVAFTASLDTAIVDGDNDRLRELVQNLVQNAVHYNRPGGRVHVSTSRRNGTVALEVQDTGIGVPAAVLPHVFERFYRGDAARAAGASGSGLGLAIAKWIVEAHGGSIRCTSEPGRGTTFAVQLPAHAGTEPAAPASG
jgi:two-component system, OmpR family, sensor kinase